MKISRILIICLAIIFVMGCKTKTPKSVFVSLDEPKPTMAPTIISNNNQFAFDMYKKISPKPENLFFSPYSISTSLAMTYTGARENTAKQMAMVTHFGNNGQDFNANYQNYLITVSNLNTDEVHLYPANSMWAQKDFGFKKEYANLVQQYFSAELKNVDFIKTPEKCRTEINDWAEMKTNKKIVDLVPSGMINDLTRLVLVNAIYFKAPWQMPFDEKATRKMNFVDGENAIPTDFMTAENNYKYYATDNFSAIEIPYAKGSLAMMIVLPKDNSQFKSLKDKMDNKLYEQICAGMTSQRVKLIMPKFKITAQFELSELLKGMGMTEAFSDKADFSGMTGKRDLEMSKVIHKAYIDVNEAGTEAAAATAVVIRVKSMPVNAIEFKADHPFLFIIKENTANSMLFVGNVYDPTK